MRDKKPRKKKEKKNRRRRSSYHLPILFWPIIGSNIVGSVADPSLAFGLCSIV
jgi:hypothetical protein